jgi:hypothetical protein
MNARPGLLAWMTGSPVGTNLAAIPHRARSRRSTPDYRHDYFGAGVLQAADALKEGVPPHLAPRPEATLGFVWVDAVLSTIAPAGAGPERLAASDPEQERLHRDMFKTELAQLTFASRRLQDILGDRHPDELCDDGARRRAFLAAAREEPDCSERLRAAIDRALADPNA